MPEGTLLGAAPTAVGVAASAIGNLCVPAASLGSAAQLSCSPVLSRRGWWMHPLGAACLSAFI